MFPRRGKGQTVAETLYVEDVFSAFTDIGTGASLAQVNGIDLAGRGGLVMLKGRSAATDWAFYDTVRGVTKDLVSNSTAAETTQAQGVTAFNADGFTRGTLAKLNTSTATYVGWTFRKAARFFHEEAKSHTNGVASTVDLSVLGTVGMVVVKQTDGTGDWWVWHRSLTAGNNLRLNTTAAQSTTNAHLSVSGTTLTIASGMATGTYIVYAWAHDTASDGIIQCGSFTTNASGGVSVSLGWEPQFLLCKRYGGLDSWALLDTARRWDTSANDARLLANSSSAEGGITAGTPTAAGFDFTNGDLANSAGYVYMAIRKGLMRTPTDASKVFEIVARTGTGAGGATISLSSIKTGPDTVINKQRSGASRIHNWQDRLRGAASQLTSDSTAAETTDTTKVTSFNMDGVTIGNHSSVNANTGTFINYFLKQARGYHDTAAYNGTGVAKTEPHNLGVVPELIIVKSRSAITLWPVFYGVPTMRLGLNVTNAAEVDAYWNDTAPTDSVFSVGTHASVNGSGNTYIAHLFASCPGVSKIDTYTGTGAAQNIDCGFTAGARFVLIKRIDSTGDWYYWDSTRGIVSGNDPYLLMNSTAQEVTSTDYIEPYSAGFALDATAPAALNASGGTYLFFAVA